MSHASRAKRDTRKKSLLGLKAILAVSSIAAALLVAEVCLQLAGYWPALSWEWQLGNPGRILDREVIMIRPDFLDAGFYEASPGDARFLALGDSFTEGYPVSLEDSYPSVLEGALRERGRPARVLNMGLGNSGPDIQLRLLQAYGLPRFDPDLVIWAFYPNDLDDNLVQPAFETRDGELSPLDVADHWTYRRRRIYDGIPLPESLKKRSTLVRAFFKSWEAAELSQIDLGEEARAASRARIPLAIREARRLSRQRGFDLLIVLMTPQVAYLDELEPGKWSEDYGLQLHRELRRMLRREGPFLEVFHLDALEAARKGMEVAPLPGCGIFADGSRDGAPVGQNHFNEEGYRRTALMIADHLENSFDNSAAEVTGDPGVIPPSSP